MVNLNCARGLAFSQGLAQGAPEAIGLSTSTSGGTLTWVCFEELLVTAGSAELCRAERHYSAVFRRPALIDMWMLSCQEPTRFVWKNGSGEEMSQSKKNPPDFNAIYFDTNALLGAGWPNPSVTLHNVFVVGAWWSVEIIIP
jgi:hypothetical protein